MTTGTRPIRTGVNYTPSQGWFHHWLDFDLDPVRRDLDSIADLGLDHVRVFPLWPLFQPNRTLIRPRAIDQLVGLVDAAAERGLDVSVDGLQGHLSSFDFTPSWVHTWHRRNLFTDPEVVDAQAAYLRALAEPLADRPNFLGMTLGNEVNQFSGPPHPDPDPCTPAQAGRWLERLLAACEAAAPGRLHVHGEYDALWFRDDHPFTPAHAARLGGATVVHSWVFNGTAQRHGPLAPATLRHAEYQIELSKAWAEPGRPVWLQEVGAPAPLVPPDAAPEFARRTLDHVSDCADLYAVTWWCSHDVPRSLADFPELEYSLGLMTSGREVKQLGATVAEWAAALRAAPPEPRPRRTALVLDAGAVETAPGRSTAAPGGAFCETWARLAADGARPAVVLAQHARDPAHLAPRGITDVVWPHDVGRTGPTPPRRSP
ncbi:glycoside hydrolase 5 family protein [Streptomyces alkaliterrae]|uniref:Glycosyl hydrolase n=1 Tax=Streptomyces alkaliterrae TaxID=2213162 RepID=A0A7W3ZSB4_9ACTN|nr:glycosyl hydrolase [Streptomyces alkaliterrae]MBB1258595.1 glycosyl hydrolase [Streptomyces alkaliterrae]